MAAPIPSLTGLRFLAAFSVFLSHALGFIVPLDPAVPQPTWYVAVGSLAGIGMPLFYALSGFVIHYNYSDTINNGGGRGVYNFFVARFARLYPLFLFCVAYDVIFSYTYSSMPASTPQALPYYLTMTQTWFYTIMGKNALVYQFGVMPSVGWSISTEWFFYCAYPFLCYGIFRLRTPRRTLIAIGTLCGAAVASLVALGFLEPTINGWAAERFGPIADVNNGFQDSFYRWLVYFSPYSRVLEFALGCLCAEAFRQSQRWPVGRSERMLGGWITAAAVGAVAVVFAYLFPLGALSPLPAQATQTLNLCFGMAPPIALLIFCCARYNNAIVRSLSRPLLVLGGEASYSLYMFHLMVIYAFRWEAAPATSNMVLFGDFMRLGLTAAAAVGLSLVTWRLIEVPSRRWLRARLTLRPPVSANAPSGVSAP